MVQVDDLLRVLDSEIAYQAVELMRFCRFKLNRLNIGEAEMPITELEDTLLETGMLPVCVTDIMNLTEPFFADESSFSVQSFETLEIKIISQVLFEKFPELQELLN